MPSTSPPCQRPTAWLTKVIVPAGRSRPPGHDWSHRMLNVVHSFRPRSMSAQTNHQRVDPGQSDCSSRGNFPVNWVENGDRRPTLELLALSHTYRVPLDDLVAAPAEGDPRTQLKARQVKGRTVIPLTQQLDACRPGRTSSPLARSVPSRITRRLRVDLHPVRPPASHPRGQRLGDGARRRGGVRHRRAALVRQHRRRAGRDPQHLGPTRRTDDPEDPSPAEPFLTNATVRRVRGAPVRLLGRVVALPSGQRHRSPRART